MVGLFQKLVSAMMAIKRVLALDYGASSMRSIEGAF